MTILILCCVVCWLFWLIKWVLVNCWTFFQTTQTFSLLQLCCKRSSTTSESTRCCFLEFVVVSLTEQTTEQTKQKKPKPEQTTKEQQTKEQQKKQTKQKKNKQQKTQTNNKNKSTRNFFPNKIYSSFSGSPKRKGFGSTHSPNSTHSSRHLAPTTGIPNFFALRTRWVFFWTATTKLTLLWTVPETLPPFCLIVLVIWEMESFPSIPFVIPKTSPVNTSFLVVWSLFRLRLAGGEGETLESVICFWFRVVVTKITQTLSHTGFFFVDAWRHSFVQSKRNGFFRPITTVKTNVRIFLLPESFSPNKTKKDTQISSNHQRNKKRVYFSCIWYWVRKHFCFGTEIFSQMHSCLFGSFWWRLSFFQFCWSGEKLSESRNILTFVQTPPVAKNTELRSSTHIQKTINNQENVFEKNKHSDYTSCRTSFVGHFCVKTKANFFSPKNKRKKNGLFSFSLTIGRYLGFFWFCFVGWKAFLDQKYSHKRKMVVSGSSWEHENLLNDVLAGFLWLFCVFFFLHFYVAKQMLFDRKNDIVHILLTTSNVVTLEVFLISFAILGSYMLCVHQNHCPIFLPMISGLVLCVFVGFCWFLVIHEPFLLWKQRLGFMHQKRICQDGLWMLSVLCWQSVSCLCTLDQMVATSFCWWVGCFFFLHSAHTHTQNAFVLLETFDNRSGESSQWFCCPGWAQFAKLTNLLVKETQAFTTFVQQWDHKQKSNK